MSEQSWCIKSCGWRTKRCWCQFCAFVQGSSCSCIRPVCEKQQVLSQCHVFVLRTVICWCRRTMDEETRGIGISAMPPFRAVRVWELCIKKQEVLKLIRGLCSGQSILMCRNVDEKKRGFGVGALLWFGVVEADAARLWITQYGLFAAKSRRARADFPGAKIILDQISSKPARRRVGFLSKGPPARGASTSLCSLKKITSVPSFFLFFFVCVLFYSFLHCFWRYSGNWEPLRQMHTNAVTKLSNVWEEQLYIPGKSTADT